MPGCTIELKIGREVPQVSRHTACYRSNARNKVDNREAQK